MRCAIFIDGAYLTKTVHELGSWKPLDYQKLTQLILPKSNDLLRVNYYDCHPYASKPPTADEARMRREKEKLFASISELPRHEVRLGAIVRRGDDGNHTYHQKLVDTMISVDIVEQAISRQVQTIVLLAGDSDFKPAIEAAKRHGILTVLWSGPRHTVHDELAQLADEHHTLTQAQLRKLLRGHRDITEQAGDDATPSARPTASPRTPAPRRARKAPAVATQPVVPVAPAPASAPVAPAINGNGHASKRRRRRKPKGAPAPV